jgi:hypothetical protein
MMMLADSFRSPEVSRKNEFLEWIYACVVLHLQNFCAIIGRVEMMLRLLQSKLQGERNLWSTISGLSGGCSK